MSDLSLAFIDKLSKEDCNTVIERARARLKKLRTNDPMVYGVKRVRKGQLRGLTCIPGGGWKQTAATNLNHSYLFLTSSREWAEYYKECLEADSPKYSWEVFELPKTYVAKLPCYHLYKNREEFAFDIPIT